MNLLGLLLSVLLIQVAPSENTAAPTIVQQLQEAATQGDVAAQVLLSDIYWFGEGVPKDYGLALLWCSKAAESGHAKCQERLGIMLETGQGVAQDAKAAVFWYRKAAEQGAAHAQYGLGRDLIVGAGVAVDIPLGVYWLRRAANQGVSTAQYLLGGAFASGEGVPRNYLEAYKWFSLAAASGSEKARQHLDGLSRKMDAATIAKAQELASSWVPKSETANDARTAQDRDATPTPSATGSGFLVDADTVLTNYHVAAAGTRHLVNLKGSVCPARLVAGDKVNDLAILRVEGLQGGTPASFRSSVAVKLGESVVVAGYPLRGLLATGLQITTGVVSALSGVANDSRYFQITAPVQQGNSGGPLLDEHGQVIGVVTSKLDAIATASITGDIPQNVNFAIKVGLVRGFLEGSGIQPRSNLAIQPLTNDEIARRASQFTVVVECFK